MSVLFFLLGLVALIVGAEVLVRGASRLALSFGISPLVVGLTIVAFGTSSPELAVSVQSAFEGKTDLAVANVVGSNIVNVLFILGLSALITPLIVDRQIIRQEVPIMIGASLLLLAFTLDGGITRLEGGLFLSLLAAYTVFLIVQSRRQSAAEREALDAEYTEEPPTGWQAKVSVQVAMVIIGLGLLMVGANLLVDAAIRFATWLGVSEVVIGLTVVAIGTSLPEIATSIMAAIRGQRDIAVGNVVGSNTFNILGVLGASALVSPSLLTVSPSMLALDIPVMLAVAVACLPIFMTGHSIARWEGGVFLAYYVAYTTWLVLAAQQHDALTTYGTVMMSFVLPITLITLVILVVRHLNAGKGNPH